MKITIKTKSNPTEQAFTVSSFEYPTSPNDYWVILNDDDGDPIHMFAADDVLYIGVDYEVEDDDEAETHTPKEVLYHKTGILNNGSSLLGKGNTCSTF